jgi:hypothetical protein
VGEQAGTQDEFTFTKPGFQPGRLRLDCHADGDGNQERTIVLKPDGEEKKR